MSRSRRRRSPSPTKPHHAGVAYRMDAMVVALATRWSSCDWRPWVRRSLNANIEEEQVFKTCETWSVMVNLALRRTPRTLSVVTLSAPDRTVIGDGVLRPKTASCREKGNSLYAMTAGVAGSVH